MNMVGFACDNYLSSTPSHISISPNAKQQIRCDDCGVLKPNVAPQHHENDILPHPPHCRLTLAPIRFIMHTNHKQGWVYHTA